MPEGTGPAAMPVAVDENVRRSQVRRALTASVVGTSIEWYDFFLYGTAAALVFPKVFFPGSSAYAGVLESFATYAVGFAARPLGAYLFGHFGDRLGRKATLIATLVTMGVSSALIGLLPGHATLGVWAAVILVLLRVLQGIAVGGEWGGSVVLAMEWGDQRRRGLVGSIPQLGVPIGLMLSTGAVSLFVALTGESGFEDWGWRIPFLLSIVIAAVGLYIRLGVLESPMFKDLVEKQELSKQPANESIRRDWKRIIASAGVRMSEQMPFYIFTSFILAYGTKELGFDKQFMVNATLVAAAIALVAVPFFGNLSDRVGRRRMYVIGAVVTGLCAFPYFALLQTKVAWVVFLTVALSLIPHNMQYGPQAAYIAENFGTRRRYSGAGMGYQFASLIAGGPAPLLATYLLHKTGTPYSIAVYIVVGCVITIVCSMFLSDRTNADMHEDDRLPGSVAETERARDFDRSLGSQPAAEPTGTYAVDADERSRRR